MPRTPLITVMALALVLACASDAARTGTDDLVVLDEVHVLGTSESLARVLDVQPAPGDTVWVLNNVEPHFVAFSPEGEVVRAWGKRGAGPGEVQFPGVLVDRQDGVWVFDRMRFTMMRISAPEGQRTEFRFPDTLRTTRLAGFDNAGMGDGKPWMRGIASGFTLAVPQRYVNAARLFSAEILVLNPEDASVRSLLPFLDVLDPPSTRYGDASLFLPFPLWDVCADERIVLYDPIINMLRRFTRTGDEQSPIPLPPERREAMDAGLIFEISVRNMMQTMPATQRPDTVELREAFDRQLSQLMPQFADVFPEYADLHCADAVWLQPFDLHRGLIGRGPGWLRVKEDGTTKSFEFPARFTPYRFTHDRVWGVLLDALDVPSIAWIDID